MKSNKKTSVTKPAKEPSRGNPNGINVGDWVRTGGDRTVPFKPLTHAEWFLKSQGKEKEVKENRAKRKLSKTTGQVTSITGDIATIHNAGGESEAAYLADCAPTKRPKWAETKEADQMTIEQLLTK